LTKHRLCAKIHYEQTFSLSASDQARPSFWLLVCFSTQNKTKALAGDARERNAHLTGLFGISSGAFGRAPLAQIPAQEFLF
jgi:hypothetical protein